jgi:integration host factor subunit alpha
MTLTKAQIVDEIHTYMFWDSKKKTVDLIETLLEIMKRTLESGEDMMIRPRRVVTFIYAGRLTKLPN